MKIREAEHEEGGRIAGFRLLGRFMPPATPEIEGKRHFFGYYFLSKLLFPIVKSSNLYYHKSVTIPECYASIVSGYGTGAPCRSRKQ